MNSASKIAIAIVAVALVIVIGLIALTANKDKTTEIETTPEPAVQATEVPAEEPDEAAVPAEEAQDEEAQSDAQMYEGALAGLSEKEIGELAMAEEQQHSGETGEEIADEEGAAEESVAGVAD